MTKENISFSKDELAAVEEAHGEIVKAINDAITAPALSGRSEMAAISLALQAAMIACADAAVWGATREGRKPRITRFLSVARYAFEQARERFAFIPLRDGKGAVVEFRVTMNDSETRTE